MLKTLLLSAAAGLLFPLSTPAQFAALPSPVNWEKYRISERDLSLTFPKLPLRENNINACKELDASTFYAYGEEAVYEFAIYAKLQKSSGYKCYGTMTRFGEQSMQDRFTELRGSKEAPVESPVIVDGRSGLRFTTSEWTRWVISDVARADRWIELAVHHYPNEKPDFDRFFKSLEFSASAGMEIGRGADTNSVDPVPQKPASAVPNETGGKDEKVLPGSSTKGSGSGKGDALSDAAPTKVLQSDHYRTVSQPKARYTDTARKSETQGAVRLKITLLASGNVGSVIAVTELPDGLTENAITAARRIVFLPKRVGKTPVSVVVTREYTFTIY